MIWLHRYRLRSYFAGAIWILPVLGMFLAFVAVRFIHSIELKMGLQSQFDPAAALTFLATMAASMFTLIVFVCSALLIAVQLASSQLTPRIIGLVLQSRGPKLSLTLFVFAFTFSLGALVRIKDGVPPFTAYVAAYGSLASLGVFFYLVDNVCRILRPSGALALTAQLGREVIDNVYPHRFADWIDETPQVAEALTGEASYTIRNRREGVVLAFDPAGLVSLAQRFDCLIEMVPQVGDFVGADQPLFRIFGNGVPPQATALHQLVAIGRERTLQQDPAFAFRIMVDIASKGLSPAINDPTTAVLVIDQIQYLLRCIGNRHLDEGQLRDARGVVRVLYRTPGWEDFVHLAITEIRQFGGTSIQVARRLRAMLMDLIQTLPGERTKVLQLELCLLDRSAKRLFVDEEDRAMADVSDLQGVGGRLAAGPMRHEQTKNIPSRQGLSSCAEEHGE